MKSVMAETLWRRIHHLHERDRVRFEPDGELLHRFAQSRDEPSFEELLRRHGPLVWGVCVRTLGIGPEAEDAFQAVFLLLIQKAARIGDGHRLGGWLHGTARKVVYRAGRRRRQRRDREQTADPFPEPGQVGEPPRDWLPLFDRALEKLPEKYREVLILCELQQRPRPEVAAMLSLNENTLSSRLARAKEILRAKLAPTGLALPALLVTAVPAALQSATLRLTLQWVASPALIPLSLLPLIHGGSKLMLISKSLACVAVGSLLTLGLVQSEAVPQAKVEPEVRTAQRAKTTKDSPKVESPVVDQEAVGDLRRLQGNWTVKAARRQPPKKPDGKPAAEKPVLFGIDELEVTSVWFRDKEIWLTCGDFGGFIGTFSLGERFDPKRIDIQLPGTTAGESTLHDVYGVYSFSPSDELTLVIGADRLNRPTLEKGDGPPVAEEIELTLTREPTAEVPADKQQLLGHWEVTSAAERGKPMQEFGFLEFLPKKAMLGLRSGPNTSRMGGFKVIGYSVDNARNPRRIDLEIAKGVDVPHDRVRGIYSIEGDTLALAISQGNSRPSEFESIEGSEVTLIKAQRKARPELRTEPSSPSGEKNDSSLFVINAARVRIPVRISDDEAGEIRSLRLWASTDRGKKFEMVGETTPSSKDLFFDYMAKKSGEVHFAVMTIANSGEAHPQIKGLKSELKVKFVLPEESMPTIAPLRGSIAPKEPESDRLRQENRDLRRQLDELMKRVVRLEGERMK